MTDEELRRELADLYMKLRSANNQPKVEVVEEEDDPIVEPGEVEDKREKSRKVYCLSPDASLRVSDIPARPSACKRVFRYLQKFEVGTVKQIAASLNLDKKTIGNSLSALAAIKLVSAIPIPISKS